MSALGQKQTFGPRKSMSASPPKADIGRAGRDVRFVPKADIALSVTDVHFTPQSGRHLGRGARLLLANSAFETRLFRQPGGAERVTEILRERRYSSNVAKLPAVAEGRLQF